MRVLNGMLDATKRSRTDRIRAKTGPIAPTGGVADDFGVRRPIRCSHEGPVNRPLGGKLRELRSHTTEINSNLVASRPSLIDSAPHLVDAGPSLFNFRPNPG